MNTWEYQKRIVKGLSWWAGLNIAVGAMLQFTANRFWKGFGLQSAGWGFIDGVIAFLGNAAANRRKESQSNPEAPLILERERVNLLNLLWVNTGFDVIYLITGLLLARGKGKDDRHWRGQGIGVVFQGGFLFLFDLFHALTLNSKNG